MSSEVCHYLNMNKRKTFTNTLNNEAERSLECTGQKRLSEAEVVMDRKSYERRNSDIALYETNQQLESQRLELHQVNQWADQARGANSRLFGELSTKHRIYQEHHARDGQKIRELRRICCKQADRVRQLSIVELSMQKKENTSNVNQLLSQIQELQDKVNSLNAEKEFYDPETASSSGMSHVLSQPSRISSPGGTVSRDSCLPHNARNSMGTSGNVFEDQPVLEGAISIILRGPKEFLASSSCELRLGNTGSTKRHGEGLRRDPRSSIIPTPRFTRNYETWNPLYHTGETHSQNCMMDVPRYSFSEWHFGKFPDSGGFQCWRVNFKTGVCV